MKLISYELEPIQLEKRATELLEQGFEIKKPLKIDWRNRWVIKFSDEPNPNSSYLSLKRTIESCQRRISQAAKGLK